jgi:hypothetical protein
MVHDGDVNVVAACIGLVWSLATGCWWHAVVAYALIVVITELSRREAGDW